MNRQIRHRFLAATALAALLAGGTAIAANPQHQDDQQHRKARKEHRQDVRQDKREDRQERREDRHEARQERREERRDVVQARRDDRREVRQDRREDRQDFRQDRRADRQEWRQDRRDDRREFRQDRREDRREFRQDRREDRREWRQDAQRRQAYARYRQDYDHRMRSAYVRIVPRYYVRPAYYRYSYGGNWYRTSNYGAEMLRMAVENGYREGLRAGRAARYDGWPGGFRDSFAWRDAAFGYGGRYVSRADYAYYFRQGFERGYDDGYYGRMRYGRYVNNEAILVEAVLGAILNLQLLR